MKMCMDAWTGCWGVALKFLEVPQGSRKGCIFLKEKCEPADEEALDKQGNIWHVVWKAAVSDMIDMSVTTVNPLNHVTAVSRKKRQPLVVATSLGGVISIHDKFPSAKGD